MLRTAEPTASLVAESLVVVPELGRDLLDPGGPRAPREVAAAIARLLAPEEAPDAAPSWLRPHQVRSFRRLVAAVRRHGGGLLADPVGTGKTFIALAAAAAIRPNEPVDVVAPAVLADAWRRSARTAGIDIRLTSHELASRGRGPPGHGPVVIDESHRFRTPATRRYHVLAPLLIGRPVLLVSATPIVNRLADLGHQLRLAVRDDALRARGTPSLERALAGGAAAMPIADLVVAGVRGDRLPARSSRSAGDWLTGDAPAEGVLRLLDRLRFSRDPGIAALLRTGFLRAFASSLAALRGMVRRYALLLDHAAAAMTAGRRVSRRDVDRCAGVLPDQLVLWELIDDPAAPAELALSDRPTLAALQRRVAASGNGSTRKLELLQLVLADRRPAVVFSAWTDTIDELRARLTWPGVAWVNGSRAGIGSCRYPRRAVLDAFDPAVAPGLGRPEPPWLLLSTDVAAEGLNLHRVSRVVHFDLPWTQVRIDQRDGRALRSGSMHPDVDVVRFDPPPAVEARLQLAARLHRKGALPEAVGLGNAPASVFAWQRDVLNAWCDEPAAPGWAVARSAVAGVLAGFEIRAGPADRTAVVLACDASGRWSAEPAAVLALLAAARCAQPIEEGARPLVDEAVDALVPVVRRHVRLFNGREWLLTPSGPASRLVRLAHERLREARRSRDHSLAGAADRVLAVLARGRTAGEEILVSRAAGGDSAAWRALSELPPLSSSSEAAAVRLVGVVVFAPDTPAGGAGAG